jgi:hypothetical protein
MSVVKRQMERNEEKRAAALGIALEAGVLQSCAIHEDTIIGGSDEVEEAYDLGDDKFADGSLKDVFDSPDEMKEYIKAVVEENADGECGQCSKD